MKPNRPYEWTIDLHGGTKTRAGFHSERFVGTVDAALAEADELESSVGFDVKQIIITRGKRA